MSMMRLSLWANLAVLGASVATKMHSRAFYLQPSFFFFQLINIVQPSLSKSILKFQK